MKKNYPDANAGSFRKEGPKFYSKLCWKDCWKSPDKNLCIILAGTNKAQGEAFHKRLTM